MLPVHFTIQCSRLSYVDPTATRRTAMIVYGPHKNTATGALQQVPCALRSMLSCAMGDVPKAGLQLCLPEVRSFAGTRSQKQTLTVRNSYQKLP